jgi:hypothetical protein
MGYITWTDETGSATLSNLKTKPGRRFSSWVADVDRVGDRKPALGTGIVHEFLYRTDYTAKFSIEHLPATQQALMIRFKNWAMAGCLFQVYTEDAADRVYTCRLRPSAELGITMSNAGMLEYTMVLEVISAADPVEPLLCHYRE